ncbi:hypothetical protein Q3G72_017208 [Acer saccharum]|nr:hypothetical protein Q3G72_017208 [Acer saccharum]
MSQGAKSTMIFPDSVATFALGILSSNIIDMYDDNIRSLDANTQLTAFWAPFILLHLGGPDTITAYTLEDNELWLRHLLGVVVQTGMALYVFLMAWSSSSSNILSILSLLMFLPGIIKYGERTWVLKSASTEQRRKSMVRKHNIHKQTGQDFSGESMSRRSAGYFLEADRIVEVQIPVDFSGSNNNDDNNNSLSDEGIIITASRLLELSNGLLLDATLNNMERDTCHTIFRNISSENAFKVIEIELGGIYDLLYTKMPLLYTTWGIILHLITFFITCLVLFLFLVFAHMDMYSRIDLSITFALLGIAIILEIYTALQLFPDRLLIFSGMHNKTSTIKTLTNCFPLLEIPRWSNRISQYSLLSFTNKAKPLPCTNLLNIIGIEMQWNIEMTKDLRNFIFKYLKQRAMEASAANGVPFTTILANNVKELSERSIIPVSITREEFEYNIVIWHIATEIQYYMDGGIISNVINSKLIKQISRYMMYLLFKHPSMLPVEILSQINFEEISSLADQSVDSSDHKTIKTKCEALFSKFEHTGDSDHRENDATPSLVFEKAVLLLNEMNKQSTTDEKWEKIGIKWLELMAYAASKCKKNEHAQQLRRGGELLTHVWLLMSHFGLNDHRKISAEERPIAKLVVK